MSEMSVVRAPSHPNKVRSVCRKHDDVKACREMKLQPAKLEEEALLAAHASGRSICLAATRKRTGPWISLLRCREVENRSLDKVLLQRHDNLEAMKAAEEASCTQPDGTPAVSKPPELRGLSSSGKWVTDFEKPKPFSL